jgi:hypothetical protein
MSEPHGTLRRVSPALEARLEAVADRLRRSEQDAAAAGVLAGGGDRDVAQFRGEIRDFRQATTSSFNALREDLGDLRESVATGFIEMRGKLDATAAGQQQIVDLLNTLAGQHGDQPQERPQPRPADLAASQLA